MRSTFKFIGAVLLFAALFCQISCGNIIGKASLSSNRRLWSESKISNYRMLLEIQKTGHRAPMGFAVIEVRNGAAVSVSKPPPDKWYACGMGGCEPYDTVEKIFGIIENAQNKTASELVTEYDSKLGYPKLVRVDYSSAALDDELLVRIVQLEAVE